MKYLHMLAFLVLGIGACIVCNNIETGELIILTSASLANLMFYLAYRIEDFIKEQND